MPPCCASSATTRRSVAVGTARSQPRSERARVHADHRAVGVDERTAGEAARDLAIGLDVAVEAAARRRVDLGAEHADRAERGARGAPGPADREREVADREAGRARGTLAGVRPPPVTRSSGDVGARVAADDLGVAARRGCRRRSGMPDLGAIGGVEARA